MTTSHVASSGMALAVAFVFLMFVNVSDATAQTCPPGFSTSDCEPMAPPQQDDVTEEMWEDGDWTANYRGADPGCSRLFDGWNDAQSDDRVWYTDDLPSFAPGEYYGAQDGNGDILIDSSTFTNGEAGKTAIHEIAHDLGCDDNGGGTDAERWTQYCFSSDPIPPPQPCNGF